LEGEGETGGIWDFLSFFSQNRKEQLQMLQASWLKKWFQIAGLSGFIFPDMESGTRWAAWCPDSCALSLWNAL